MDYLRGNATASAVGLFVICGYLSTFPEGRTESEIIDRLQVLRRPSGPPDESGPVLSASLKIGTGLGFIRSVSEGAPMTVEPEMASGLQRGENPWPWFRGELLRRVSAHGLQQLETDGSAPDLVLGLTWFLQSNPLTPIPTAWGAGPEPLIQQLNFQAISRSEQWRPFQRWALALGLARRSDYGSAKVLIPDASTAIADQQPLLPTVGRAAEWLATLRRLLPVLGDRRLLDRLPKSGPTWVDVPPGVILGLLKLEKSGVLLLEPSDDAADVIPLSLGTPDRQVGRISWRSN